MSLRSAQTINENLFQETKHLTREGGGAGWAYINNLTLIVTQQFLTLSDNFQLLPSALLSALQKQLKIIEQIASGTFSESVVLSTQSLIWPYPVRCYLYSSIPINVTWPKYQQISNFNAFKKVPFSFVYVCKCKCSIGTSVWVWQPTHKSEENAGRPILLNSALFHSETISHCTWGYAGHQQSSMILLSPSPSPISITMSSF